MQYFEDISVGETHEFGSYEVTEEEIISFAEQYDPQPFHTDPEAAEESFFGRLVASGWHTAAITMRLIVDHRSDDIAALGAKGLDDLRWRQPVFPGDVLSVRTEVVEKRADHADRGELRTRTETLNQNGDVVLSYVTIPMVARRTEGAESTEDV